MYVAFCIGGEVINFGKGKRVYGAYGDIEGNALFTAISIISLCTMAKREIPMGFSLLGV